MTYGERQLDKIIAAYGEARKEYPDLPYWPELSTALRMAFIEVYSAGRKDARDT